MQLIIMARKQKDCDVLGKRLIPQYLPGRWASDVNHYEVVLPQSSFYLYLQELRNGKVREESSIPQPWTLTLLPTIRDNTSVCTSNLKLNEPQATTLAIPTSATATATAPQNSEDRNIRIIPVKAFLPSLSNGTCRRRWWFHSNTSLQQIANVQVRKAEPISHRIGSKT